MKRVTHRWLSAGIVFLSTGVGGFAQAQSEPVAIEAWSSQVWRAAEKDGESELLARLAPVVTGDIESIDWLRSSIEVFKSNLAKREQTRVEQIAKVSAELDEHMAMAENPVKLSEALRAANELQLLMPNKDEFFAQPRIEELIRISEIAGQRALEQSDWLIANELFARLSLLYENEERYKNERDTLEQRLTMIRMYAPDRFWQLRNDRRLAAGEEAFPDYNPTGDQWNDKIANVRMQTVLAAVTRTYSHVDGVAMREVLVKGFDAVIAFVTTPELYGAFTSLADDAKREAFLTGVKASRNNIANKAGTVTRRDAYESVEAMMVANTNTIGLPAAAIAHEFGNGAMKALDQYSGIIWPDELARFERSTRGEFVGVGISIQLDELQNIKVVTPLEGSPAQRAGIRAGDLIKKVNGNSTVGFTLDQAVDVITGPRGTKVSLTIERQVPEGDAVSIDVPLVRQVIDLPTVKGWKKTGASDDAWDWFVDREAGVGYLRLTGFSEKTTTEFDRAVREMKRQGLQGLILDLRFNPGGLLEQAVSISSRFVNDGLIVRTVDGTDRTRDEQVARAVPNAVNLSEIPVIVLINEGSASASEIVSGAIQAHAREGKIRALVVGQRSFGKGSVQNVFPIQGDDNTLMKLTTQYYKLRGNQMIHRRPGASEYGIKPDLAIEMLPQQSIDALVLRRDADVLPLDENGKIIETAEMPNPDRLISEGLDLQLEAAVVLLQSQQAPAIVAKMSRIGG
ncbi:MAG: S41 family peptidase [Phycisphaeraceae bacterium]|nr:S41 family peptidase [Phycisphaeraceae bacterium]MCW5762549.1 S41 family peptidase [Phycisphaeraceae bacterium]